MPTALFPLRRKACWGFFFALKIRRLRPGANPRTWVPKAGTLPLDHRRRYVERNVGNCNYWDVINVFEFPDQLSDYQFSQEALSSLRYVDAVGTFDGAKLQDMLLTVSPSNSIKTVPTDKVPHQSSSICCPIVLICHLEGRHKMWQICLSVCPLINTRHPFDHQLTTPTFFEWTEVLKYFPGGPWFKFRHADKAFWVLIIVVFLSTFSLLPHIISRPIFYISSAINFRQSS
jgi:hypothetical protein